MTCTTHHHACDCREAEMAKRIAELEKEVTRRGWQIRDLQAEIKNKQGWIDIENAENQRLEEELEQLREASCD